MIPKDRKVRFRKFDCKDIVVYKPQYSWNDAHNLDLGRKHIQEVIEFEGCEEVTFMFMNFNFLDKGCSSSSN